MAGFLSAFKHDAPSGLGSSGLLALIKEQAADSRDHSRPVPIETAADSGKTRHTQIASGPNVDKMPPSGGPPSYDPGDARGGGGPQGQPSRQIPRLFPSTAQDFGEGLIAGLSGVSRGVRSGGLLSGILGGMNGLPSSVSPDRRASTVSAEHGVGPGLAQAIGRDPDVMRAVLPRIVGLISKTGDAQQGGMKRGLGGGARSAGSPAPSGTTR